MAKLEVGDRVRHWKLGVGVVQSIEANSMICVYLEDYQKEMTVYPNSIELLGRKNEV